MLKKVLLPTIFAILAYGFWVSPNFKEIAAGVSVFLFGMLFLEEGFKAFTGGILEKLLKRSTSNLSKSIGFGILTTTVMQSSSLVSVITISFLSAGLIDLAAGIGIIFGANIGTTTGAWLVAGFGLKVKISAYAMPMLVFGIILVLQSSKNLKGLGFVLAGLGFLFLGIHFMKEGFEAFRDTVDLAAFALGGYLGLLIYAGIGLVATVIMQSSHATLVLIITALASQQITYENGLALAIGANVGTTITAVIGSLSANYQGKRLAGAHLIFNVVTGVIAIAFIHQLVWAVDAIAVEVGIRNNDYTMKLAVFHTVFNVIGVSVMTPFILRLVGLLEGFFKAPVETLVQPRYLNDAVVEFPETLLEAVRNESIHLYDNAFEVMAHGLNLPRHGVLSNMDLKTLVESNRRVLDVDVDDVYTRKVKVLFSSIVDYTSRVHQQLPQEYANDLYDLRRACGNIVQSVKDVKHLRKNLSIYLASDNPYIRDEYNRLRMDLSQTMRLIHKLREDETGDVDLFDLDEVKVSMEKNNSVSNGNLDKLIRKERITPIMGTSLMNDIDYAKNIVWNLTEVGGILFGAKDLDEHAAEMMISLDPEDVEKMPAPPPPGDGGNAGNEEANREV